MALEPAERSTARGICLGEAYPVASECSGDQASDVTWVDLVSDDNLCSSRRSPISCPPASFDEQFDGPCTVDRRLHPSDAVGLSRADSGTYWRACTAKGDRGYQHRIGHPVLRRKSPGLRSFPALVSALCPTFSLSKSSAKCRQSTNGAGGAAPYLLLMRLGPDFSFACSRVARSLDFRWTAVDLQRKRSAVFLDFSRVGSHSVDHGPPEIDS
jgi:hypothetical protein